MREFKQDLTSGSVMKQLIKFSVPLLLSNIIQTLYSVADMLIVGKFVGSYGISGVGIGTQVTMLITATIIGFAIGGTVLIAQYVGAKRDRDAEETIATIFTSFTIIGAALTVVMLLLNEPLLRLLNTPQESFAYAKDYVAICMAGTLFIFLYNGIAAVMRGLGDSKRPLYFVTIAAITNVLLDLLLVGVFNMEVKGAAIATICAQALSVVLSIVYLYKHGFVFDFRLKSFKIHKEKLINILRIGLPTAAQQTLISCSFLFLTGLVNLYGVNASSAANVVSKISSFAIMPTFAMSSAISSIAGQNIGAKQHDRALETLKLGMGLSVAITAVVILLIQLFPEAWLRMFTDDARDLVIGIPYIRVYCFDWLVAAFLINFNGLIIGAGHTMLTLVNAALTNILVRVPASYVFAQLLHYGMQGIAAANAISGLIALVIAFWYIRSGRWRDEKRRRVLSLED